MLNRTRRNSWIFGCSTFARPTVKARSLTSIPTQDAPSSAAANNVRPVPQNGSPRYFYQGSGSIKSRLLHSLSFAVILRGDNGRPTLNYSFLLGDIGSGLLSNLYYPHGDRRLGLVFTNASIDIESYIYKGPTSWCNARGSRVP